jgi:hypothetical protein
LFRLLLGRQFNKVLLMSNPWFAGLALAPLGYSAVWYAQKAVKPIAQFLTKRVDLRIENAILNFREKGYADLLLQSLDLQNDLPENIQNVGS